MTPEQHIEIAHERIKETKIMLDNNCCGAACNRAYYAAHVAARAALIASGVRPPKTHNGLNQQFHLHIVKNDHVDKPTGSFLSKLEDNRIASDYLLDTSSIEKAEESYSMAITFVDAIQKNIRQMRLVKDQDTCVDGD